MENINSIIEYCKNARLNGASIVELYNYINKKDIDEDSKEKIKNELSEYDKILEKATNRLEMQKRINKGFKFLIIGAVIGGLALFWTYLSITRNHVIAIVQIILGLVAIGFMFEGLLMVISGNIKKDE